ncbi:hypothetical protein Hanom_Chr03g00235381 [Helianthus anomalus]
MNYGIHLSQVNTIGLPRLTHFKFICRAQKIESTFETFNVFFIMSLIPEACIISTPEPRNEGVPKVAVVASYVDEEWYKTLTRRPTPIIQLEEKALVVAGMSLMWVPREPRAYPVYAYKG